MSFCAFIIIVISMENFKLKAPFNMLVTGASGSGKSTWVTKLMKQLGETVKNIGSGFERILYCYSMPNQALS